jgi:hypothetical protein
MNKSILVILATLFLSGCSVFKGGSGSSGGSSTSSLVASSKARFKLTDKAGEFVVYRENGRSQKRFVSKRQVLPFDDDKSKVLEQGIAISEIGVVGKNFKIMRPYKSQYSVWFDGKKYQSNITLNSKTRKLDVKLKSPEKQWNGVQSFSFPDSKSIYCFFSQVLECAAITGYFSKVLEKKRGQMNFYIIWDGYPYFQEQYLNVPSTIFSKAQFNYDGRNKLGESRFSLKFGGQVLFYLLDKKNEFVKKFWITQGLSMVASDN